MAAEAMEDLAGGAILDEVARLHRVREEAAARILALASEWAVQLGEGRFDLGARMQLSPYASGRLIADVLDLEHRLPRLWDRVLRLEVRDSWARHVARKTRESASQARYVYEREEAEATKQFAKPTRSNGPMVAFHHRIKAHGRRDVEQPFPGIYVWRDPYGAYYLVDHTGTRRVDARPTTERPRIRLDVFVPQFALAAA